MSYLTKLLPMAVVALGVFVFVADADAGHRRRGGCGCDCDCGCGSAPAAHKDAAVNKEAPPAVADNTAPRTERSFSVEPSQDYAPSYRSSRSTGSGGYGLDYTQRQKGYFSR